MTLRPKTTLALDANVHDELHAEAERTQRPCSWLVAKAWKHARLAIKALPAPTTPEPVTGLPPGFDWRQEPVSRAPRMRRQA